MSIKPFSFEGLQVRVVAGEDGEPRFVAKDVCAALGLGNDRDAIARHVDPDDVGKADIIDELGRKQGTNCINESGVYALIFGSRLESAKRFKRWVTSEVLPAIRKTGSFVGTGVKALATGPHDERASIVLRVGEWLARVPGVKPEIAAACTLQALAVGDLLATPMAEAMRKALPVSAGPASSMNATAVGERVGLSARAVNLKLSDLGLQRKNERGEWELTEAGAVHGEALPYSSGRHAGYQVLWRESVLAELRESR